MENLYTILNIFIHTLTVNWNLSCTVYFFCKNVTKHLRNLEIFHHTNIEIVCETLIYFNQFIPKEHL